SPRSSWEQGRTTCAHCGRRRSGFHPHRIEEKTTSSGKTNTRVHVGQIQESEGLEIRSPTRKAEPPTTNAPRGLTTNRTGRSTDQVTEIGRASCRERVRDAEEGGS